MPGKRGPKAGAAIVAVLVLASSLSGCFLFAKMKWDPAVVKRGKKTVAVVSMIPELGVARDKMVPFVLVGLPDNVPVTVSGKRKFDVNGDYGGPKPMFSDSTLRNVALQTDNCAIAGGTLDQVPDLVWTALRTEQGVSDRDKLKPPAVTEIAVAIADGAPEGQVQAALFSGNWSEAASPNGIPEEPEVTCSGGSTSSFTVDG
jgi:hypothetical protein